jgi:DNA-directed RNA polymerase specialized sigma24 family protein
MQDSSRPVKPIHVVSRPKSHESWLRGSTALREEIRLLVHLYDVRTAALDKAFEEALWEFGGGTTTGESRGEERRSRLLGIVLYKLFVANSPLWIRARTASGNEVPTELLVAAYAIWQEAEAFAERCNVDAAVAAEALAEATHAVADGAARNGWRDRKGEEIKDVGNYLFQTFGNRIVFIAGQAGLFRTDHMDMMDYFAEVQQSDKGLLLNGVESGIFCREVIDAMPPRGRSVAILRYMIGYTWPETAEALGITVGAAQKALSVGFKKVQGIGSRELQKEGDENVEPETPKRKNRRTSLWR